MPGKIETSKSIGLNYLAIVKIVTWWNKGENVNRAGICKRVKIFEISCKYLAFWCSTSGKYIRNSISLVFWHIFLSDISIQWRNIFESEKQHNNIHVNAQESRRTFDSGLISHHLELYVSIFFVLSIDVHYNRNWQGHKLAMIGSFLEFFFISPYFSHSNSIADEYITMININGSQA